MTTTVNLKKFNYQVKTFINDEEDVKKFNKALNTYKSNKNVQELTDALKIILDRPERLRMYDVLRPLIPPRQQMEYNMLVPYISNKLRKVQLNRRRGVTSFGFAIRGGREHGIGVYVSDVEDGSEASKQGLRIGDQIVRVNGLNIEEAIHEEVLNLMSKSRNSPLELSVKSVGMVPVKTFDGNNAPNTVSLPDRPTSFPQPLVPATVKSPSSNSLTSASQTPTSVSQMPSALTSPVMTPQTVHSPVSDTSSQFTVFSLTSEIASPLPSVASPTSEIASPLPSVASPLTSTTSTYSPSAPPLLAAVDPLPPTTSPLPETTSPILSTSSSLPSTSSPLPSTPSSLPPTSPISPASTILRSTSQNARRFSRAGSAAPLVLSPSYEQLTLPIGHKKRVVFLFNQSFECNQGALSWRLVTQKEWPRKPVSVGSTYSSEQFHDVKVYLTVKPSQKFGCNICKGPQDRPGIFIQSTKEGGLAHEVGLRAGDKLLEANGRNLQNLEFQEAVEYLKSCKFVELVVRRGVGVDLFPGESSGYNSSNSSTVGDHPIPKVNQVDSTISNGEIKKIDEESSTNITKEVVADVIIHTAERDLVEKEVNANSNLIDDEEEERRKMAMLRHHQEREEAERKMLELEEEKKREMEYISKKEIESIEEKYVEQGQRRKDSILLQLHLGNTLEQFHPSEEIQEEEEHKDLADEQEQIVIERMQNTEKMVRTAETLMDRALSRTSSNSSGGDSGLHMKEDFPKDNNDEIQNEKWKKTVLAEIHNTPRPSLTNEDSDQDRSRKVSLQSQTSTMKSDKSADQVIEEFRQTHKKLFALALEKRKNLAQSERSHSGKKDKEQIILDATELEEDLQKPKRMFQQNSNPNLIEYKRRNSVFISPVVTMRRASYAPIGNPAAHKFVETPQVSKVEQDPFRDRSPSVVFPPLKTNIFGPDITDSSQAAPRPPDYFFPKVDTKPKVTIISYDNRPAPKRFEYLKQHPSVEVKVANQSGSPKPPRSTGPEAAPYITKVTVNKPQAKPAPVQPVPIIKKPTVTNGPKPAEATINNNNTAKSESSSASESRIGFNAARSIFMNGNNVSQDRPKPTTSARGPMSTSIQSNISKFQVPGSKVNGVIGGNSDIKEVESPKVLSRTDRRQRTPLAGDNKVRFEMPKESLIIIEPQK